MVNVRGLEDQLSIEAATNKLCLWPMTAGPRSQIAVRASVEISHGRTFIRCSQSNLDLISDEGIYEISLFWHKKREEAD